MSNLDLALSDISTKSPASAWFGPTALLAMGTFAMGTDSFVLAGILPQISTGLAVSDAAAGQVVTVFALTYGLAAPLLAAITATVPRKPLLIAALALFSLANLGSGLAPNFGLLLVTRVVAAIAAALFTPSAYAAAATLAGAGKRGQAISIVLGGLTIGTIFGVPVGTLLGQQFGWHVTMIFVAIVAALPLPALMLRMRPLPANGTAALRQRFGLLADLSVLAVVGVTLFATAGGILVYTYISTILASPPGIDGAGLTIVLLAWGVAGSIGAFASGWATDRFGAPAVARFAVGLVILTLLVLAIARSPLLVAPIIALFGLGGWSVSTPNNHRLAGLEPVLANVAISLNSSGAYLGQALGAALGGVLVGAGFGPAGLCIAGAGLASVALLIDVVAVRSRR